MYKLEQILKTKTKEIFRCEDINDMYTKVEDLGLELVSLGYIVQGIRFSKDGKHYIVRGVVQCKDGELSCTPKKEVMQHYYSGYTY